MREKQLCGLTTVKRELPNSFDVHNTIILIAANNHKIYDAHNELDSRFYRMRMGRILRREMQSIRLEIIVR